MINWEGWSIDHDLLSAPVNYRFCRPPDIGSCIRWTIPTRSPRRRAKCWRELARNCTLWGPFSAWRAFCFPSASVRVSESESISLSQPGPTSTYLHNVCVWQTDGDGRKRRRHQEPICRPLIWFVVHQVAPAIVEATHEVHLTKDTRRDPMIN